MAELDLESLAIKELFAEIEKRKRQGLPSRLPPQRQVRPNKRFLGRTIISVLQHNRRQSREEKQNSFRKLDELNRRRHTPRSREMETTNVRKCSPKRHDLDDYERQIRLEMCFLGTTDHLTTEVQEIPKKEKKKKSKFLTIDLTKKKKKSAKEKKKKKKRKLRKKKIKSKKRRRRKDSTSSSSSDSSSSSSSCTSTTSLLEDMNEVRHTPKPKKKHTIRKKKTKSKKRRRRKNITSSSSSSSSSSSDSSTNSLSILEDIGNVEHSPKLTIDLT